LFLIHKSLNLGLTVIIDQGCSDSIKKTLPIYPNPIADFTWNSNCTTSDPVTFQGIDNYFPLDTIIGRKWIISDNGSPLIEVDTVTAEQIQYTFAASGNFSTTYFIYSDKGCKDSVEKEIVMSPTYSLSAGDYLQDFEDFVEGWSSFAESGEQNSWYYGDIVGLEFPFTAASGQKVWYTDLTDPKTAENSWVQTPCFSFEGTSRPMISVDIKQSMVRDREGVVMQYTDDNGQSWNNIGAVDDGGLSWFNSSSISNGPAGQSTGWTGKVPFSEDTEWETAAHQIDQLLGKEEVRFRIVYGSSGDNSSSNGFAFDNFRIKERSRLSLLEYFTSANSSESGISDPLINNLTHITSKDAVDLQYHTDSPVPDKFNLQTPVPASTRGLYYGISAVPYAIIDGGVFIEDLNHQMNYDFTSRTPGDIDVSIRSLMEPDFELTIDVDQVFPVMQISVGIEALKATAVKELILYTVVLENLIEDPDYSGTNGLSRFENIVRKILPDAGGITYDQSWEAGDKQSVTISWEQPYEFLVADSIAVVVFLQDYNTNEVLQASKYNILEFPTSSANPTFFPESGIRIFPNPATDLVHVRFDDILSEPLWLQIYDFSGRIVHIEEIPAGIQLHSSYLQELNSGLYIIGILNRDRTRTICHKKLLFY